MLFRSIKQLIQQKDLTESEIENALKELTLRGLIQTDDGFFFLNHNAASVMRRREGEIAAAGAFITAKRFSRIISNFPFVRAVAISGSLSKNYIDDSSDIDYFIITSQGRMWVARTLLVLYKKIFLFNSHKNFCVNYFLSEDSLLVPDRNIFTATEISFLVPTYNYTLY